MYESPISLDSGLKVMYSNGCGSVDVTSVVNSVVVVVAKVIEIRRRKKGFLLFFFAICDESMRF